MEALQRNVLLLSKKSFHLIESLEVELRREGRLNNLHLQTLILLNSLSVKVALLHITLQNDRLVLLSLSKELVVGEQGSGDLLILLFQEKSQKREVSTHTGNSLLDVISSSKGVVLVTHHVKHASFFDIFALAELCHIVNMLSSRLSIYLKVVAGIGGKTVISQQSLLQGGGGINRGNGERDHFSLRSLHNDVKALLYAFGLLFHCDYSERNAKYEYQITYSSK